MQLSFVAVMVASVLVTASEARISASAAEMRARAQEMAKRRGLLEADTITAALTCFSNEPCQSESCTTSMITLQTNSICSAALDDEDDTYTLGVESSNGDSLGVVALMAGGDLDEMFHEDICTNFANDNFASSCVVPAPIEAVLQTIGGNPSSCAAFATDIISTIQLPDTTEAIEAAWGSYTASAYPSSAQVNIINESVEYIIQAVLAAANMTDVTAAMVSYVVEEDSNYSWADLLGGHLGFLPTQGASELSNCEGNPSICLGVEDIAAASIVDELFGDYEEVIAMTAACSLVVNNATTNTASFIVNKLTCYKLSLGQTNIGVALFSEDEDSDAILTAFVALDDSMATLESRCETAGVSIQSPTGSSPSTSSPTTASPTAAPVLNPASAVVPHVLLVALTIAAAWIM